MFNLEKFLLAQQNTYSTALKEISCGKKYSHYMWFIFPQLKALGLSNTAKYYGIENLQEAKDYLNHPILGARLKEISTALLKHNNKTAIDILGDIDAIKLCSSMTLFAVISNKDSVFHKVLDKYFNGIMDPLTLKEIT